MTAPAFPKIPTLFFGAIVLLYALPTRAQQPAPIAPIRLIQVAPVRAVPPNREITPPAAISANAHPASVTLKPGPTSSILRTLQVKREYSLRSLRAHPIISLGTANVDMTPLFVNHESLDNVAGRLRAAPALVAVVSDQAQVLEVPQGLIVRQFLTYRVKPGACSDPKKRARLAATGARCFSRVAAGQYAASFANPADPHFVANPAQRATTVQLAQANLAKEQANVAARLKEFHAVMSDPARRAKVVALVGPEEAARLEGLSDDQLEAELVNSGETQIEETMFVPRVDKLDVALKSPTMGNLRPPTVAVPENVDAEHALPKHIYLTGFTLGRNYEWRKRVSITIDWCLVDCSDTYYAEVYAGFDYGFGLRFPIDVGGLYAYHQSGFNETATITPAFLPIDGDANDYSDAGLPSEKLFNGKELVAQFDAYAGLNYDVPVLGSDGIEAKIGKDFTEGLPAPFTNGQFRPPAPGDPNPPSAPIIFDNPDLIGGLANFGVAGAKVLPAVRVALVSDRLQLRLTDELSGRVTEMTASGTEYPLAVAKDHSSSFSIGDPEYDLSFHLTPGLDARLFVDVAVWDDHWDWTVWFPQLEIKLPPGGAKFTCHADTVCTRHYHFSPKLAAETGTEEALSDNWGIKRIQEWQIGFSKKWRAQCPYEAPRLCEVAINATATTAANKMIDQFKAHPLFSTPLPPDKLGAADQQAQNVVLEARLRDVTRYGTALGTLYDGVWARNCVDQLCHERVHSLVGQFQKAMIDRQRASPSMARDDVFSAVMAQDQWPQKAMQEVAASEARNRRAQLTSVKALTIEH